MTRYPELRLYLDPEEIIVDSFAGGGGASSGLGAALGREPFVAINHDAEAIAMHRANHPTTKHYIEDVWEVDPLEATEGKPVALAWFSPDCTHFSKARGGKPRSQRIRALSWVAVKWARAVAPRVIALENVEELLTWGPLHRKHSKRCTKRGRARRLKAHGDVDRDGNFVPCIASCHYQQPIKARAGETWRQFLGDLRDLGYVVEWKLLRACDYGAPTTRRRLFLVARRDGRPIVWPQPTHGPGRAHPFRTAAECIDWTIACPSIFDRSKPLADKTLARIARGIRKYVIESARPFIVPLTHPDPRVHDLDAPIPTITGANRGEFALVSPTLIKAKTYGGGGNNARPLDEPIGAITASKRGEHAVATAYLVHRSNGERVGQAPRIYDAEKPLGTIVGQGQKHALCVALLNKHHGGNESTTGGQDLRRPVDTIASRDQKALTVAHLSKLYGTSTGAAVDDPAPTITSEGNHLAPVVAHLMRYNGERREGEHREVDVDGPLPTIDTANRYAMVAAFLARYNGTSTGQHPDAPLGTVDTTDRYSLVTVTIDGEEYAIVDIGMRMLSPRELYNCQGFAADYVIDPVGPKGKPLTKTAQIRMVGNSVPPPAVAAIARAQLSDVVAMPPDRGQLGLFGERAA